MFRSSLLGLVLAGGLAFQVSAAEVIVKVAPPHAIVEKRGEAPSKEHVWIAGYHNWDGHAYVWVPGRWERPPRPHAVWVAHTWKKRGDGYVMVEGHWK
jgi:hypothetical protein